MKDRRIQNLLHELEAIKLNSVQVTKQNQTLTDERAAAVNRGTAVAHSLQVKTQQNAELMKLNDELNAHARILTTERDDILKQKDTTDARAVTLEAQVGHIQEKIKELQTLVDTIPNLQESLNSARVEAEQVPVLQEPFCNKLDSSTLVEESSLLQKENYTKNEALKGANAKFVELSNVSKTKLKILADEASQTFAENEKGIF